MKFSKKNPKIIILSDIHAKASISFDSNSNIPYQIYLKSLRGSLKKEVLEATHLIINGDISFSGEDSEYNTFWDIYIVPLINLREENNKEELIIIPIFGNHDIRRKNLSKDKNSTIFDEKEVEIIKESKKDFFPQLFTSQPPDFDNISLKFPNSDNPIDPIVDLSSSFRTFFVSKIKPIFVTKKDRIKEFGYVNSEGLFGIIWDKKYNLIFNCLNSAWFAFGNEILFDLIVNNTNETEEIKEKLLKNELNEVGNLEYLSLDLANNKLNDFNLNENIVISLSHHPITYCKEAYSNKNVIESILNKTDFLITAHEHIEPSFSSIYRGKCYHIETPQLFDFKYEKFYEMDEFHHQFDHDNNPGYKTIEIFNEENIVVRHFTFQGGFYEIGKYEYLVKISNSNLSLKQLGVLFEEVNAIRNKTFRFTSIGAGKEPKEYVSDYFEQNLNEVDLKIKGNLLNFDKNVFIEYIGYDAVQKFRSGNLNIDLSKIYANKLKDNSNLENLVEYVFIISDYNLYYLYKDIVKDKSNLNEYFDAFTRDINKIKSYIFNNDTPSYYKLKLSVTSKILLFDDYKHYFLANSYFDVLGKK